MVCFCGDMVCTYVDFIPCFSFFLFSLQCSFSVYRGAAAALLLVLLQTLWEYTAESMWVIELQKSRAAAAAQQQAAVLCARYTVDGCHLGHAAVVFFALLGTHLYSRGQLGFLCVRFTVRTYVHLPEAGQVVPAFSTQEYEIFSGRRTSKKTQKKGIIRVMQRFLEGHIDNLVHICGA